MRDPIHEFHMTADASRLGAKRTDAPDGPTGNEDETSGMVGPYRTTGGIPAAPARLTTPAGHWCSEFRLGGGQDRVLLPVEPEWLTGTGETLQLAITNGFERTRLRARELAREFNACMEAMRQWERDIGKIHPAWAPEFVALFQIAPDARISDIEVHCSVMSSHLKGRINIGGGVDRALYTAHLGGYGGTSAVGFIRAL